MLCDFILGYSRCADIRLAVGMSSVDFQVYLALGSIVLTLIAILIPILITLLPRVNGEYTVTNELDTIFKIGQYFIFIFFAISLLYHIDLYQYFLMIFNICLLVIAIIAFQKFQIVSNRGTLTHLQDVFVDETLQTRPETLPPPVIIELTPEDVDELLREIQENALNGDGEIETDENSIDDLDLG